MPIAFGTFAGKSSASESAQTINEKTNYLGKCPDRVLSMANEDECNTVLQSQIQTMEELDRNMEQLKEKISAVEWQLEPIKQKVVQLREQFDHHQGDQKNHSTDASLRFFQEAKAWYRALHEFVTKTSAMTADTNAVNEHRIKVTFEDTGYVLNVHFDAETTLFASARLDPPNVPCEDIVAHAVTTQDVCFLVREIQARLYNQKDRKELLVTSYKR